MPTDAVVDDSPPAVVPENIHSAMSALAIRAAGWRWQQMLPIWQRPLSLSYLSLSKFGYLSGALAWTLAHAPSVI